MMYQQQQMQRPMGGRYRGFMMGRGRQQMQDQGRNLQAMQSQAMPGATPTPAPTPAPAPTGPTMSKDPNTGQAVWGMPAPPEHSVDPTPPQSPMPGGGGAPPLSTNAQVAGATANQGRDLYQQQRQPWRPGSEMVMNPRMPQQRNNLVDGGPLGPQDEPQPRQRPGSGIVY